MDSEVALSSGVSPPSQPSPVKGEGVRLRGQWGASNRLLGFSNSEGLYDDDGSDAK